MRNSTITKVTDLPSSGQFGSYEWTRYYGDSLALVRRPDSGDEVTLDAFVTFPGGKIDFNEVANWEISVSKTASSGGSCEVDEAYIHYFEELFQHLEEEYGQD